MVEVPPKEWTGAEVIVVGWLFMNWASDTTQIGAIITPVPEPSAPLLMLAAMAMVTVRSYRKQRHEAAWPHRQLRAP